MKTKVFISQPMNGKTNEEIILERNLLIEKAKERYGDVKIIDSFFKDAPHNAKPLWFLGKSIELLADADVAYFAKDWDKARGCRIENQCAISYGVEVVECYDY